MSAPDRFQALGLHFPYFVAPMVGISHVAFRELVRHYTPKALEPRLFTEMISSKRLPHEQIEDTLRTSVGEDGLIPQLLCNEEDHIQKSLRKLVPVSPWGVDINMGCPVTQTLKHNWGVQLMHDKDRAARVVGFAKKHCTRPVSVKLRAALGRTFDEKYLLDFTRALENAGADWLTIHCRTQEQGHHGYARWDMVEEVARERRIPIVANGDVHTWEDALRLRQTHHVDGVMIARAATARPWILWQIGYHLGIAGIPKPPLTPEEEGAEYFASLLRLSCLLEEYYGETPEAVKRMVFYLAISHRWLLFGHDFMTRVRRLPTLWQMRDFINDYRDRSPQPLVTHARV